ncbi:MAG: heavy metal-binding domain-containing protein [Streptococcaceae bacterium]|nr:heavy metal-binding domain-containing protein [Streptococcaceae bacterium]
MADFLIVTTENIPGYKVVEVFGEVFGVTSRSRNIGSNFLAGLKTIVGGEIPQYTALVQETRDRAIEKLRAEASEKGANAIVMMRFDTEAIMQGVGATVAYGTAVKIVPVD